MLLIFVLVVSLLIVFDYKLYKTYITPFTIIVFMYSITIVITNLIGYKVLNINKVWDKSIIFTLYFLILIFIVSLISNFIAKRKYGEKIVEFNYEEDFIYRNTKIIFVLFIIGLVSKYISLIQCIQIYGLAATKGKAFGIFAHIGGLSLITSPFLFLYFMQNKYRVLCFVLLVFLYINLFLFGGKYGIFITSIHGVILYFMITDIKWKKIVVYGVLLLVFSVVVFMVVYAIKPMIYIKSASFVVFYKYVQVSIKKFLFYFLVPLSASNHYFFSGVEYNIQLMFTVPINIFKAITGNKDYINPIYTPISISSIGNVKTNVGGLFAESVYNSDILIASVYIVVFFLVVYYFYIQAKYNSKKLLSATYLLSVVSMMFFANFLTVSVVVLNFIYLYILETVLYYYNRRKAFEKSYV